MSPLSPKREPDDITQEQFDQLLDWLDPDREKAALRYEWIRKRLIKMFVCRASTIPEELSDITMNRVARKLPEIRADYVGDPANYVVSVAKYIFRESLRKDKPPTVGMPDAAPPDENDEKVHACFEKCLDRLPAGERDLVLSYYQHEKHVKIDHRRKLAEQLALGMNGLRIRACRIRARLQECVERCCAESGEMVKHNASGRHT